MNIKNGSDPLPLPHVHPLQTTMKNLKEKLGADAVTSRKLLRLKMCFDAYTIPPFCRFIAIQADLKCCISATEMPLDGCAHTLDGCAHTIGERPRGRKKAV